jgi:thiamine biosynthesis lipoprotein
MGVFEVHFDSMGSRSHILAVGGPPDGVEYARRRVEALELQWSRFIIESEVARCNRAGGRSVVVSESTIMLMQAAVTGWRTTNGTFDPSVATAMDANGYGGGRGRHHRPQAAPGLARLEIDVERGAVRLPAGVEFDPGGIGKGLAADLVVVDLAQMGVDGALVSLGGDVRTWGTSPDGDDWLVAVQHPLDADRDVGMVALRDGAVATSSSLGRCWRQDGEPMHHIVDPRTGRPVNSDVVAVTAIAAEAWWAEVMTKSLFVSCGRDRSAVTGGAAMVWFRDGSRIDIGPMNDYFI